MSSVFLCGVLLAAAVLCPSAGFADGPVLKVAVLADGRITANGELTTLESLRDLFKRLADEKGEVWYYREAAQSEAPPQAMAVIEAVVENQLPVRLSTKPDYSDVIGSAGQPVGK